MWINFENLRTLTILNEIISSKEQTVVQKIFVHSYPYRSNRWDLSVIHKNAYCFSWSVKIRRRRKWYRRVENKYVQRKLDIAGTAVEILVDQAPFEVPVAYFDQSRTIKYLF